MRFEQPQIAMKEQHSAGNEMGACIDHLHGRLLEVRGLRERQEEHRPRLALRIGVLGIADHARQRAQHHRRHRNAIAEVDPNLTITGVQMLGEEVASNFDQQPAVARLAGLFGSLALLLASVGLYGVTGYTVARRTSEIGVRMALGADRRNVIRLVLRGALQLVGIGLGIGIPVAILTGRLMGSQLFEVKSCDPALAVCLLAIAAVGAAFIPAQRAASINPVVALRTK
jgi:predicted lysophospholipase L1 biosynthesis ABC-type transport system permease subunit